MQQRQAQQQQMEEQRNSILDQILDESAKDRLKRLNLVRKDKARAIEDSLIKAATTGQLRNKVTDDQLVKMLEGTEEAGQKKVSMQRRNYGMDSDDDDNDDDLM
jgi:DNA-binding TFAR19-related protein (PDSD5 family)